MEIITAARTTCVVLIYVPIIFHFFSQHGHVDFFSFNPECVLIDFCNIAAVQAIKLMSVGCSNIIYGFGLLFSTYSALSTQFVTVCTAIRPYVPIGPLLGYSEKREKGGEEHTDELDATLFVPGDKRLFGRVERLETKNTHRYINFS